RGILATPLLSCELAHKAQSAVPFILVDRTVKGVSFLAAGKPVPGSTSAMAIALAEEVFKGMFISKLKIATVALLAVGLVGLGAGTLAHRAWIQHKNEIAVIVDPARASELPAPVRTVPADQDEQLSVPKLALQNEKSDAGKDPREAEEVITKSFTTNALGR